MNDSTVKTILITGATEGLACIFHRNVLFADVDAHA
jgi:short-subunit dehydrogenase